MGIRPRHASAAFGYIVPGGVIEGLPHISRVKRFTEKPTVEVARSLIEGGALWNAGIVVARADAVIAALRTHEPSVIGAVERSLGARPSGVDDIQLDEVEFVAAPKISFDKAVLERHGAVAVTALDAVWRDVGTWAEVAELYAPDGDGNRQMGRVNLSSSRDTFVFSPNRLTVGIGLRDLVVVDTPDALLIASRVELGLVREVVEAMSAAQYPEVAAGDNRISTVLITLGIGETVRRDPHRDLSRFCIVLQGRVTASIEGSVSSYGANDSFYVPPGVPHTLVNRGSTAAVLIDVHVPTLAIGASSQDV